MEGLTRHFDSEKYPKINNEEILKRIRNMSFFAADEGELRNTDYYSALNTTFIIDKAIIIKLKSSESNQFTQCIHWIGIGEKHNENIPVNEFFLSLLSNSDVSEMPQLKKLLKNLKDFDYAIGKNLSEVEFYLISPYSFDGELAEILYNGGAYIRKKISAKKAKLMALDFAEQIMQYRYDDFKIFSVYWGWSDWFYCIAWDYTYFILDEVKSEIMILAITDSD